MCMYVCCDGKKNNMLKPLTLCFNDVGNIQHHSRRRHQQQQRIGHREELHILTKPPAATMTLQLRLFRSRQSHYNSFFLYNDDVFKLFVEKKKIETSKEIQLLAQLLRIFPTVF